MVRAKEAHCRQQSGVTPAEGHRSVDSHPRQRTHWSLSIIRSVWLEGPRSPVHNSRGQRLWNPKTFPFNSVGTGTCPGLNSLERDWGGPDGCGVLSPLLRRRRFTTEIPISTWAAGHSAGGGAAWAVRASQSQLGAAGPPPQRPEYRQHWGTAQETAKIGHETNFSRANPFST